MRIDELAGAIPAQPQGHGVDGEVPPRQVVAQRAVPHRRQRAGGGVGLGAGRHQVDVPATLQVHDGGPEARVGDDARAEGVAQGPGHRDGVALDHQVELLPGRPAQQGVADRPADRAHIAAQVGTDDPDQRVIVHEGRRGTRIDVVAYDPVSRKLADVAPVAPELLEVFEKYEGLTLTELRAGFEEADRRFQEWVRDPANEGRPISEAPDYLDRIALDSLLERRMWWRLGAAALSSAAGQADSRPRRARLPP